MSDTKISEARIAAAQERIDAYHPQPAELADAPAGHELAYAVEKALGNRDGKRDAELDELLAMAMNELNAINTNVPAELAEQQGRSTFDVTDPWRGLYLPARMPAPSEYGDLTHPDIPLWPDDREDALDKLVHAQGFDFHIVAGDFTEPAMEDGDDLYWQEMRAWNPEAPEGEWRWHGKATPKTAPMRGSFGRWPCVRSWTPSPQLASSRLARCRGPMTKALDPRAAYCHGAVKRAIRDGVLRRPESCQKCGKIAGLSRAGSPLIQGHHEDYSQPLDVVWLCPQCHRAVTPLPAVMGAPTPGSRNGQAKMHESQIKAIRESPLGAVKQSRIYGVSVTRIKDIRSGRYWSHVK